MTTDSPKPTGTDAPRERRPRKPRTSEEKFGCPIPWENPLAVVAYWVAQFSLIPLLGVVLGPLAILLGLAGLLRWKLGRLERSRNFCVASIILGTISFVFNAAGLFCLGWGWNGW